MFDLSVSAVKIVVKSTAVVILVVVSSRSDFVREGITCITSFVSSFRSVPEQEKPYQLFDTVKQWKGKVDSFDYEDILEQSNSWIKTLKKFRSIVGLPVSIGVSLFRFKKDETRGSKSNIIDGTFINQDDDEVLINNLTRKLRLRDDDDEITDELLNELEELAREFDS